MMQNLSSWDASVSDVAADTQTCFLPNMRLGAFDLSALQLPGNFSIPYARIRGDGLLATDRGRSNGLQGHSTLGTFTGSLLPDFGMHRTRVLALNCRSVRPRFMRRQWFRVNMPHWLAPELRQTALAEKSRLAAGKLFSRERRYLGPVDLPPDEIVGFGRKPLFQRKNEVPLAAEFTFGAIHGSESQLIRAGGSDRGDVLVAPDARVLRHICFVDDVLVANLQHPLRAAESPQVFDRDCEFRGDVRRDQR